MDVKYQVFVSSTFVDLQDERRSVIEAILNMGHIPVGMEAFQASDDTQWDYIKRRIDESDYYVVIVGERYGSEQDGKSYTQMEYEYAVSNGVPVAAFLLDPVTRKSWPSDRVEHDKKAKVDDFRTLCQQKLVKFWKSSEDLAAKTILALVELTREKPQIGWVRANRVPSDEVLNEISRLSEEKRQLQQRLDEIGGSSELIIPADVLHRIDNLQKLSLTSYFEKLKLDTESPSLLDFLLLAHKYFAVGAEIYNIQDCLRNNFGYVEYDYFDVQAVLGEFSAENIINFNWSSPQEQSSKYYFLTDYGKDFVMYAKQYIAASSDEEY